MPEMPCSLPILFFLAACQPSKIMQTWTASDHQPVKYKKILVLGVLTPADNELQIKIENHLAVDLYNLGYNAVAANQVFPPGTFVKGDSARAKAAIADKGYDAVMTIVLLDKKKEQVYVPGRVTDHSYYLRYGRFDRYLTEVSERIYTPGYYTEETKYYWENNFYDIVARKLIYSARSRSFDTNSRNSLAHTYGQLLTENLIKSKILFAPDLSDREK